MFIMFIMFIGWSWRLDNTRQSQRSSRASGQRAACFRKHGKLFKVHTASNYTVKTEK